MKFRTSSAFTIVELLVVIVVIAILAAITIVSYNGITERTVIAAISSDLKNAATKLEMGKAENSSYTEDQSSLPKSPDTSYQFTVDNAQNPPYYCLTATSSKSNKLVYHISSTDGKPTEGACAGHHGPIVYTYDFTMTGSTSTSSSSINYAFTWDSSTISALQYQEYWLYDSCTGPGIIAIPQPNSPRIVTGSGSASSSLSWGTASINHGTTAALWARVRPIDTNGNPLADWSNAKGVVGKQGTWNTCNAAQSPWQTPPPMSVAITNAWVVNSAAGPTTIFPFVYHGAKLTVPTRYIGASGFTNIDYKFRWEKIVYENSGCVGSSPLIPPRSTDASSYALASNVNIDNLNVGSMRIGNDVSNPNVGAVWMRGRIEDSAGTPLTDWSAPYGAITVYDLNSNPKQVTLQTCSTSTLPPASHWPSAR